MSTGEDASKVLAHLLVSAQVKADIKSLDELPQVLRGMDSPGAAFSDYDLGIIDFGKSIKPFARDITGLMNGTKPEDFPFKWMACSVPFPGIAKIFEKSGFKGFIPKPARKAPLLEMAAHMMGMIDEEKSQTAKASILTSHSISEKTKTDALILLVEDNPVNQKLAMLMMTRAGYQVEVAGNGQEALSAYRAVPSKFDLVLMDINMPVMDGFEACQRIRFYEKEKELNPVPVLALTANVLDDFKQRCKAVGMNDFLTKPIKREVVFSAIQKWVRQPDSKPIT
ncbi:MAG: response regulator [Desulfobacter sp.]|nr:response regulator [Desulfobacter sp.]